MHLPLQDSCRISLFLFFTIFGLDSIMADKPTLQQTSLNAGIGQETVRQQANKIQADLAHIIDELKLNGLTGTDLDALERCSAYLSSLSQQDMRNVINVLQSASLSPEEQKRLQILTGAYRQQQQIIFGLKQLSGALSRLSSDKGLIEELQDLITRQSSNIRETTELQKSGQSPDNLNYIQKSQHNLICAEQADIGGEIDFLLSSPSPLNAPALVKTFQDQADAVSIEDATRAASHATQVGPFRDAVVKQAEVRSDLVSILRTLLIAEDSATRLQQMKDSIDKIRAEQQDLTYRAKQPKPDDLVKPQSELADRTGTTKALLEAVNPAAANQLATAQNAMEQSSTDLANGAKSADATAQQEQASKSLDAAEKLLDQQIAAAQNPPSVSPPDLNSQLQKAQDEIKEAQQASNPQDAAKAAEQAQQDALPLSPTAADKLADAEDQLQSPQPDTNAANQSLSQANDALQKEKDAIAQSAKDYQALTQAQQQLDQAIQLATDADQNLKNGTGNDFSNPIGKLNDASSKVDQVSQNLPDPTALQALQKASQMLKSGSSKATQANRKDADSDTQQALQSLKQARDALAQSLAQIQQRANEQMAQAQMQGQALARSQGNGRSKQPAKFGNTTNSTQVLTGSGPTSGPAQVIGSLSHKDREAINQYESEKIAPEYSPMVQQYLKNLADSSAEDEPGK